MSTASGKSAIDEGFEMLAAGQLDEAESTAQAILGHSPTDASATLLWGRILMTRGRLDDAIATFETAVRFAPTSPQMRFALADAIVQKATGESPYFRGPMWAKARGSATTGLQLAPDDITGLDLVEQIRSWEAADAAETVDNTPNEILDRKRRPDSEYLQPNSASSSAELAGRNTFRAVAGRLLGRGKN